MTAARGPVRAVLVRPSGEHTYTDIARDTDSGLSALQQIVGGNIELVPLDGSAYIYVNEEGLLDGLPVNELATRALLELRPAMAGTFLVGDAVFLGFTRGGNEADCPARIWDLIVRLATEAGIPHGGPAAGR